MYLLLLLITSSLASELTVNTTSGPIHGFYNDTTQTVRSFLGIPYAEPPTASHRFLPAVPKTYSPSPFNASSFGPTCPGLYTFSNESIWSVLPYLPWNTDSMSEDCLSLNVWAPAKRHKSGKRDGKAAVMMYVYGGAFTQGSTAIPFYDGSNIVRDNEDVVVVTFNYRVTVFGYPNAPGVRQNAGLLDQRLAVEWVQQNIANFGGDPSRIMLFGQSAGSASYPNNPIVHAFGMESGAANIITSNDTTYQNWDRLSKALGCGSGSESLECMQKKPFEDILDEVSGDYDFAPLQDDIIVFADYTKRRAAKVPTLLGGTKRETAAYFNLSSASINETLEFAQTQTTFNCLIQEAALLRYKQNIRTWRYLYHGNWKNLSPTRWLGAYHSSDVPMVFGTYNKTTARVPSSAEQVKSSRYIQGAWVAFAKDPQNGLETYGWPRYNPDEKTLINLALNNTISAAFSSAKNWDSHCDGSSYVA
ncbi:hypothetical protein MW887_005829 [Aspergillus wentii]|nr:hypothetical protein MW887_005829 [Aspergillus wentii]